LSAFIRGEFLRQSPIRNLTGIMVAVQSFAERKFPSNRGLQLVSMQTWFITLVLERCISVPSSHPAAGLRRFRYVGLEPNPPQLTREAIMDTVVGIFKS